MTGWHLDDDMVRRYAGQADSLAEGASAEQHLLSCEPCRARVTAAGPQAAHQPADRDPPQPRRDIAVTAETPRSLPDRDEGVPDRVRHQVPVVAPPGKPDRKPPGMTLVQHAESAHIAFGHGEKQHLVARAAVHDLTVASPTRKRFTPRREIFLATG
jgi:hypothetical protein